MQISCKKREPRAKRLSRWHTWFAWHPVRVDEDTMVWLEIVYRKATGGEFVTWHYSIDHVLMAKEAPDA